MVILSKTCKPDHFESHNSLKLRFSLCETNLDDLMSSRNFSARGYLPLIQKDSGTHMHSLVFYVKERLPFVRDLCLENSADSYLCF